MKLGLGTVQFGSEYGISNNGGQVAPREVAAVLEIAAAEGVEVLDTAAAYGESEAVLGRMLWRGHPFRIVTKTAPVSTHRIGARDVAHVRQGFERSLERLRIPRVDVLMVHHAGELLRPGGEALAALMLDLRKAGLAATVGVSCYDIAELEAVQAVLDPEIVQIPCNVLDRRFTDSGTCGALRARGVEVHARSLFLQGLLLMLTHAVPQQFRSHLPVFERLDHFAAAHGLSRIELALGYVRSQGDVDVGLVGVTGPAELTEVLRAFRNPRAAGLDYSGLESADEALLNPSLWARTVQVTAP